MTDTTSAAPVAWRVHPFDYGIGHEGVYAMTLLEQQRDAWLRKGWKVEPLYVAPPAVVEPLFWYRPVCNGEMYEGPVHNNSVGGKMLRDEKPCEWLPLYPAPRAVVEPLTDSLWQQHHRDSQELRRLCAERDQARRERDAVKAELAGLEASCSTLGGLVDELRPDSERLEWVLRRVSGSWLGAYLGAVSDTGDMDTLRTLIDANRGALGIKKGDSHG